jgi:hypothetical protein
VGKEKIINDVCSYKDIDELLNAGRSAIDKYLDSISTPRIEFSKQWAKI